MISNTVIVLSAIAASFALLDIFLSDTQKKRLSDLIARSWNKLDDTQRHLRGNFLVRSLAVSKRKILWVMVAVLPISVGLMLLVPDDGRGFFPHWMLVTVVGLFTLLVLPFFISSFGAFGQSGG
jgi:hypothetical protein